MLPTGFSETDSDEVSPVEMTINLALNLAFIE
jgi:hypothetical protein